MTRDGRARLVRVGHVLTFVVVLVAARAGAQPNELDAGSRGGVSREVDAAAIEEGEGDAGDVDGGVAESDALDAGADEADAGKDDAVVPPKEDAAPPAPPIDEVVRAPRSTDPPLVRELDEPQQRSAADLIKVILALVVIVARSEEHTSELQSRENLVCRLLLEKKKITCATESCWPSC